jgi:ArsR family transcriptional regulator, arsenate/arsenite/antimonite-responsive transcriptional repressor / arsenate reductase (thioredoxin)
VGRVGSGIESAPPPFARLAGHPLRWRLLSELAGSDRRVRELAALAGQPQNLVSYHLRLLRDGGLVGVRRSSFDGRDSYYHLDLARCAQLLAGAGIALHPGLRLQPVQPGPLGRPGQPGRRSGRPAVLFLCTGTSVRSQMAEALARHHSAGWVQAFSAGSHPKPVHPHAVRVMAERGIDLTGAQPKHLSVFAGRRFVQVITLCDRVREVCPEFPGQPRYAHWSIPDPAASGGDSYPAFESLAAELGTRIGFLLAALGTPGAEPERPSRTAGSRARP